MEAFIIVSQNLQVKHSYLILWCFCVNLKRIQRCSVLLTQQNWGGCSAMQILAYQFVHCQFQHCLVQAAWRTYKHTQLLTSFFWAPKWQHLSTAMTHVLCVCHRVGSIRDHSHVVVVGCCQRKVNCQLSGAEQNLVCLCCSQSKLNSMMKNVWSDYVECTILVTSEVFAQNPDLNTFGVNLNADCEPDPITQCQCLTSLMLFCLNGTNSTDLLQHLMEALLRINYFWFGLVWLFCFVFVFVLPCFWN